VGSVPSVFWWPRASGFINNEIDVVVSDSRHGRDSGGLDQTRVGDRLPYDQNVSSGMVDGRGKEPTVEQAQARSLVHTGDLNVAGSSLLNIPEHAVQLLQKAFEAMKEPQVAKPLQLEGGAAHMEQKQTSKIVLIEEMSKPTQVDVLESSK
jgi:hypothetical protein